MRTPEDFSRGPHEGSPPSRLIEREHEIAVVEGLIARARVGTGSMAALIGPAGIGKSSLIDAAADVAGSGGLTVARARGGELERDYAYGVVRQLLEPVLHDLDPEAVSSALGGSAAQAAPVFGIGPGDPAAEPGREAAVVHGLFWLTASLSQRRPLALLIDDLHWADAASVRFIGYLQRRLESLPVMVLTGSRPPVEAADPSLVEAVLSAEGVVRLPLAPLSEAGVAAMLEGRLRQGSGSEGASVVHRATAGNPFLCKIVGARLADRAGAAGEQTLDELIGGSSAEVVGRWLGRLVGDAGALAAAIAILGVDVPLARAASLAGLDHERAVAMADQLAERGVLRSGTALDFTHPLVRAAVRDGIAPAERALMHGRAATMLAAEGAAAETIAVQLMAAPAGSVEEAATTLRAAADGAIARGDPGTAVSYLRRALDEPLDPRMRATVLLELGSAEYFAGQPETGVARLEESLPGLDPQEAEGARRMLGMVLTSVGGYERAVAVYEEAIAAASGDGEMVRLLEAELYQSAMMLPSTYQRVAPRLFDYARGATAQTAGQRSLLTVLITEACLRSENAAQVREWSAQAFENGLLEDRGPFSIVWTNAAFPLVFAEGWEVAAAMVERALQIATRDANPIGFVRARAVNAMLAYRRGAIGEAALDGREAVELGREGGFRIWLIAVSPLVSALLEQGRADEAAEMFGPLEEGEMPATFLATWSLHARARVRLARGRVSDAIADLRDLRERESGWRPWNPAMFPYRETLALALWQQNEAGEAKEVAEEGLELAQSWGAPAALAASMRVLGQLTGGAGGLELLRESVALAEGSGAVVEHARSLFEYGSAIRRGGTAAPAREPLYEAMQLAHECGAKVLADQAREELVATGARPRRLVRTGVDALTPSELRVARLAAAGATNREIAQELFVTPRTVETHLTSTYRKLDVSARDDLAGALGEA